MKLTNEKTGNQIEINIRPFARGDEAQFKACISDFYGDGYPYKEYFEKGFLADLCESGKLQLLCALSDEGEMAGTVGARMSDEFPGSAIMCLRVVKSKFRGYGIASVQRTMLLEYLESVKDIKSIYVDALAHDKFSQEDLRQFGFITCGVRLQLYKADVMIPYGGYKENDRISQTIMCKSQGSQDIGEIFCPKEHENFISECYKRLNTQYKLCTGKKATGKTIADEHFDELHASAVIIIRNAGADFAETLSLYMKKTVPSGSQPLQTPTPLRTAVCYVNLSCAGAEEAYNLLKERGFFFTGLKPLNTDGEYMLMTYIPDGKINFDLINACDDGETLLNYIGEYHKNEKKHQK